MSTVRIVILISILLSTCHVVAGEGTNAEHAPFPILNLPASGTNPGEIDYAALPATDSQGKLSGFAWLSVADRSGVGTRLPCRGQVGAMVSASRWLY